MHSVILAAQTYDFTSLFGENLIPFLLGVITGLFLHPRFNRRS